MLAGLTSLGQVCLVNSVEEDLWEETAEELLEASTLENREIALGLAARPVAELGNLLSYIICEDDVGVHVCIMIAILHHIRLLRDASCCRLIVGSVNAVRNLTWMGPDSLMAVLAGHKHGSDMVLEILLFAREDGSAGRCIWQ